MSELVADRSDNPQVEALATRIIAAQGPELDRMEQMAKAWDVELNAGGQSMDSMAGGAAKLEPLKGTEFDRAFLTEMTAHHSAALPMAQAEVDNGENPQGKALATEIIEVQTTEIAEMKQLLTQL